MKRQNSNITTKRWIEKTEDDELTVKSILKHKDGAPSVACFLSQQIAEKYLKILLAFKTGDFVKIHDLKRLATILEFKVSDIFDLESEFILLNKYYITTRYPGDFPEGFSWKDAEEAYKAAEKIKDFVLKK